MHNCVVVNMYNDNCNFPDWSGGRLMTACSFEIDLPSNQQLDNYVFD